MAGRALAFSNPQIIGLAKTRFVPVACDDWYQRRRDDAEGRFFRGVADQGPRRGEDGSTRQGIYVLTADGHLLAYRNAGQSASATLDELQEALQNWEQLPAEGRAAGTVHVPDPGPLDGGYTRRPPPGALILDVFTRAVDAEPAGGVAPATACKIGDGKESARDHMWITREEARQFIPDDPRVGQTLPVPDAVARRMARFHLVDDTRGEPPFWSLQDVRHCDMSLTVVAVSDDAVTLRFSGSALLSTDADPARASRGFDVSLLGDVVFDRHQRTISKFDVAALGRHWGEGRFTPDSRPGRQPLGVVFQLSHGDSPADAVPPQAARELNEYLGSARASRGEDAARPPLKVSIYSGATEYQSDQTLAKFKAFLEQHYNVRCTLNDVTDWHTLPGTEQLATCDVIVVFTRRVECPPDQVERIKRYMESGKGVVGIRTASHAFQTWLAFDHDVLGGDYHNHVKDDKLARLTIPPAAKDHPVLRGVEPFTTMGKLYINPHIAADDTVLLNAKSDDDAEPVAWARVRAGHKDQRVFYTSLGVPADFENENFRRMLVNAIFWAGRQAPVDR